MLKRGSELGTPATAAGEGLRPAKKFKAGSNAVGSPHDSDDQAARGANGVIDEDVRLENFRKEAIWRQMQEYKRELARVQEQLVASDGFRADVEARIAAVDVCWNQLIADVRMLFEGLSATDSSSSMILDDPLLSLASTSTSATFSEAVSSRARASKDLIIHLLSRAPRPPSTLSPAEIEDLRNRCRALTAESASSRTALGLAESKLKQVQVAVEEAEERVRRAEKKLDREKSRLVKEIEGRLPKEPADDGGTKQRSSSVDIREDAEESPDDERTARLGKNGIQKPDPDAPVAVVNGVDPAELDSMRDLADARLKELERLQSALATRTNELDSLRLQMSHLPDEVVRESPVYRQVERDLVALQAEAERAKSELETIQAEATSLREKQDEFRSAVMAETSTQLEAVEDKLKISLADAVRLRQTREDARAELLEVKTRDAERMRQVDEIRTLANSRAERVEALQSEVRRGRMALAAERGEKELVEAYAKEGGEDGTKALLERAKSAEQLALALRDQLSNLTKSSGVTDAASLLRSEQEARLEAQSLRERVSYYQTLFGPGSSQPNLVDLAQKLEQKGKEVRTWEAKAKEKDGVAEMMYGEVDRLSAAWTLLDEQNRSKVFKLAESEEKILKAVHEKAKADNKYFAAMRTNEALKGENALLEKVTQKQSAAIEKLSDELKAAVSRMMTIEKEVSVHEKVVAQHKAKVVDLTASNEDVSVRSKATEKQFHDARELLAERTRQHEAEAAARQKAEEQAAKAAKELDRANAKLGAVKSGTAQSAELTELKSYNEDLTKMLKCNSCKQRFKTHVITRCMHLFCNQCLEARIETRQRKCPTCSVGFGATDVSPVYF